MIKINAAAFFPVPAPMITRVLARTLALVLTGVLASCASSGKIPLLDQPIAVEQLNAGAQFSQQGMRAWPEQRWWEAYGDLQLNRLIAQATATNPDLASTRARVNAAAAQAGLVASASRPSIDAHASTQPTRFTGQSFIPPPYAKEFWWSNSLGLNFRYALDLWGAEAAADEAAQAEWRASQAGLQAARLSLIAALIQAYSQLALEYELRDLLELDLHNRQQLVDISQQRLAAGIGTELELAQAQTSVPVGEAELETINLRIALLQHQLAALCGQGPGTGEQLLRPSLQLAPAAQPLPGSLPAELLGHRPDLSAQRWQLEAAHQGIKEAKARFYPNLDLVAGVGLESLGFYRFLTPDAAVANVGPALSLPLFDGGARQAHLHGRAARYNQRVAEYNATLIRALQQVADQLASIRSLEATLAHIQAAQALAERAHQLALKGYSAGLTNYVDVLNTETALIAQQQQSARLKAERLGAQALLMSALGGGLEVAQPYMNEPATPAVKPTTNIKRATP